MTNSKLWGSTLIEAVIALFVTSFSISGIVTLHTSMSHMSNLAQDKQQALYLAESELETVRLNAFFSASDKVELSQLSGKFTLTHIITEHPASPDLKSVEITVSWQDTRQINHFVSLETMIYFAPG